MRRHEESACASSIADGDERKFSSVFAVIPFDLASPFGLVHDALRRRDEIPRDAFDPMNLFMLERDIRLESRA